MTDLDSLIGTALQLPKICRACAREVAIDATECKECGHTSLDFPGGHLSDWPSYWTEIYWAWKVVEAMKLRGLQFKLVDYRGRCHAWFAEHIWDLGSRGGADKASEAIVRAALAALGVDVSEGK